MTLPAGHTLFRTRSGAAAAVLASAAGAAQAGQDAIDVPSGQEMNLGEVLIDVVAGETWIRFRFVAPRIGTDAGKIGYDVTARDMDHLCENLAIPYLEEFGLEPARVVISVADRDMPFGDSRPEATQFFEAYRLENDRCIWEQF